MLTIDRVRAFVAEAGGKWPPDQGRCNGIAWRLGPDGKQTTCPDCFREITSGMTVYRIATGPYRPPAMLWVCARCFNFDKHVTAEFTTIPTNRRPGVKGMTVAGAAKRLDKITRDEAPRFRVTAPAVIPQGNQLAMAAVRAQARLAPADLKVA